MVNALAPDGGCPALDANQAAVRPALVMWHNTLVTTPQHIEAKLRAAIRLEHCHVIDTTGGGDHFRVELSAAAFAGKSRVEQHQMVYAALSEEFSSGAIHALSISTSVRATI